MTTIQHVHNALRALAPAGRTIYDDQAADDAAAPWIVVGLRVPAPLLAEAGMHGGVAEWVVTVCGETAAQARVVADECATAWAEARVTVSGWSVGALRQQEPTGPYPAGLDATDTDLRFQVVRLPFSLTLSRTE